MKKIDTYIFIVIFAACMAMIFSCRDNNTSRDAVNASDTERTATSEGTVSSGTRDTMNQQTNTLKQADSDSLE
ncbi:hypothetical protein GGR22_002382 [Flavobacterium gossypii]|uniref:Entericidin n=1 Tax=Flavobacterium gossypii TaxID=1646119 RepID=A0ABR6DRA3_9FLAO|nr:hypothetical protein [Flavobacterium gossypii]MBA9074215.1 hypothetical protein [Flavobacterium gossypii]